MSFPRHIFTLLLTLTVLVIASGCQISSRVIRYNIPGLEDHRIFANRTIHREGEPISLKPSPNPGIPPLETWGMGKDYRDGQTLEAFFKKSETLAFLVMKDDTIQYEWYAPEESDTSLLTSFSMAKVYVSTLVGIALHEGKIKSVEEPIGNYLNYCTDSAFCNLKIRHLLQMTSGIRTQESYLNPFGTTPKLYYAPNLEVVTHKIKMEGPPGKKFEYLNFNTQLLAEIVKNATGKSVGEYLEEKIWRPLGMEADALWSLDHEGGHEKAFCCINARARDFARFGLLALHNGVWKGDTLIPPAWLAEATKVDTTEGSRQQYQYHWYTTAEAEDFYAEGLYGQFTYICPSKNMVIVRLGSKLQRGQEWYEMFKVLAGLEEKPVEVELEKSDLKKLEGAYVFATSTLGDSSMYGKEVILKRKGNHLKVVSKFNKDFLVLPTSPSEFYNSRYGRRLTFEFAPDGEVEKMLWERRGNFWWVRRKE